LCARPIGPGTITSSSVTSLHGTPILEESTQGLIADKAAFQLEEIDYLQGERINSSSDSTIVERSQWNRADSKRQIEHNIRAKRQLREVQSLKRQGGAMKQVAAVKRIRRAPSRVRMLQRTAPGIAEDPQTE
jgi:hypothetical protein